MEITTIFTDLTVAATGLKNVANLLINYAHFRNSSLAELTALIKSSRLNFIFTLSGRMYKSTKNSICILSFPPSLSITHSLCPSKLISAIRCSRPISPTKSILNFATPFTLLRTLTYKQIFSLSPTSDQAIKSKYPPFSEAPQPNPHTKSNFIDIFLIPQPETPDAPALSQHSNSSGYELYIFHQRTERAPNFQSLPKTLNTQTQFHHIIHHHLLTRRSQIYSSPPPLCATYRMTGSDTQQSPFLAAFRRKPRHQ